MRFAQLFRHLHVLCRYWADRQTDKCNFGGDNAGTYHATHRTYPAWLARGSAHERLGRLGDRLGRLGLAASVVLSEVSLEVSSWVSS